MLNKNIYGHLNFNNRGVKLNLKLLSFTGSFIDTLQLINKYPYLENLNSYKKNTSMFLCLADIKSSYSKPIYFITETNNYNRQPNIHYGFCQPVLFKFLFILL